MAQAQKKPPPVTPSFTQLATQCLDKTDGNITKAISLVIKRLKEDQRLFREMVGQIVTSAATLRVNKVMQDERRHILDPHRQRATSPRHEASTVIDLARGIRGALLDWPLGRLGHNKRLRDATPADLTNTINKYAELGEVNLHRARWLRLIVESVPINKKVGDVLSEDTVKELWQKAYEDGKDQSENETHAASVLADAAE